jgi:hypothetical protein
MRAIIILTAFLKGNIKYTRCLIKQRTKNGIELWGLAYDEDSIPYFVDTKEECENYFNLILL